MKKKFKIITLGCRTNQYESQAYRDQLISLGYISAKEQEPADICIVNTCSVTHKADLSSNSAIKQIKKENQYATLYLTGCMVEHHAKNLKKQYDGIEIIPNQEKQQLVNKIFACEDKAGFPKFSIKRFEGHTRAFIKIQDGCNSYCSYCIIPFLRGRSRSRTVDSVVEEIQNLVSNGYKEIVLTGINIGDYDGGEKKCSLAHLVKAVDQIDGIKRIRLSSIYADEVDDELANTILTSLCTCKSMHIVLQSGSDRVLKRMGRKYTQKIYLKRIESLKKQCPDFTVTTDIIVGFPGETQEDFFKTLDVVKKVQFAKVHVFPYSKRSKTKAFRFKNHLPKEVIESRRNKLLEVADETAFLLRQKYVGRIMRVLVESKDRQDTQFFKSHSDNFLPIKIADNGRVKRNQFVDVKITHNRAETLVGEVF